MEWDLVYGKDAETLLERQKASGKPIKAMATRPECPPELTYILEAFWLLNRSRPISFSVCPITLAEVKAYVDLFGISDVQLFVACIVSMDRRYLERHHAQKEAEAGGKKHGPSLSSGRPEVPSGGRRPAKRRP